MLCPKISVINYFGANKMLERENSGGSGEHNAIARYELPVFKRTKHTGCKYNIL